MYLLLYFLQQLRSLSSSNVQRNLRPFEGGKEKKDEWKRKTGSFASIDALRNRWKGTGVWQHEMADMVIVEDKRSKERVTLK